MTPEVNCQNINMATYDCQAEKESQDLGLQGFICPICLEIYSHPIEINCGNSHVYCASCLQPYHENSTEPKCPECRVTFDVKCMKKASRLERQIKTVKMPCRWCEEKMPVSKLRLHLQKCSLQDRKIPQFKPVKETQQSIPSDLPNRSTFQCPICGLQNLECNGLVKHCNEQHKDDVSSVVCPVCACMPWGEKDLKSSNFLQHLNLRHKFEYDTFVDYSQDDDEMLRAALEASLQDQ